MFVSACGLLSAELIGAKRQKKERRIENQKVKKESETHKMINSKFFVAFFLEDYVKEIYHKQFGTIVNDNHSLKKPYTRLQRYR